MREKCSGVSAGVGMGKVLRVEDVVLDISKRRTDDINLEKKRFAEAVEEFCESTDQMAERLKGIGAGRESNILEVQAIMMRDESLRPEIEKRIERGISAEFAVSEICDKYIGLFAASPSELLRTRACDINDVKQRLLGILLGVKRCDIREAVTGTVLAAKEFSPAMLSEIVPGSVTGIVAERGGENSHSAILARSLELPAVFNVPGLMARIENGEEMIIDGTSGEIIFQPDEAVRQEFT